jgi:hypothetical protein
VNEELDFKKVMALAKEIVELREKIIELEKKFEILWNERPTGLLGEG